MNSIKVPQKEQAEFKAYVNSIKTNLSPEQKTVSGATKLYEEWKAKQTPAIISKANTKTPEQIAAERKAKELQDKANKDALTATVRAKAEANKIARENELKNKANTANSAQEQFLNEGALGKGPGSTAYQDSMNTTIKNIKDLGTVNVEQLNTEVQETAQRRQDILKGINQPAIDAYGKSTKELTDIIDKAMGANEASIEAKRRIADGLRESAGVEALMASNNALPGLSNNQKQALAKDVAQGYQQAIAQAEGDFEMARTMGWDKIKSLGVDAKNAVDIFTNMSKALGTEIAEPILTALVAQSTNKTELIKKVNDLLMGSQTQQYADSEKKQLANQANVERALNYSQTDAAGRRQQINQALKQDGIDLSIDNATMDKLVNYYGNNWDSIYTQLGHIASLDTKIRDGLVNSVSSGHITIPDFLKEIEKTGKVTSTANIQSTKDGQKTSIDEVKTGLNPTGTTDINKSEYGPNKEKLDAANKKVQDTTNKQYDTFINGLSAKNKATIDRIKAYTGTSKQTAIDKLKSSNYTQLQKDALLYYINK